MSGVLKVFEHAPKATATYSINWGPWLAGKSGTDGRTIVAAVWELPAELELVAQQETATKASVTLRGVAPLVAGEQHDFCCTITDSAGQEEPRTLRLKVKSK